MPPGDELLRMVADRLDTSLRDGDLLTRIGGDDFVVLLTNGGGAPVGRRVAERILYSFSDPVDLPGISLQVGVSIGIAVAPVDSQDASTLLRHADIAMYEVKARGHDRGYEVYKPDYERRSHGHLSTIEDLRTSIMSDQLVLNYLPKIDLRTGTVLGVEALVRWDHPERRAAQARQRRLLRSGESS